MHHNLTRGLNLLKTVEWHVVQIACTVEITLFVAHHLLEEMVSARFALLFLEEKIISGSNLIMLIILDISYGLTQIAVGIDA